MKNFNPVYKIFFTVLVGIFTLLVSEIFFRKLNLYYELPWLDIPMHIFSGLLLAGLYIYYFEARHKSKKFLPEFYKVFIFVMTIGAFWEIYEYIMYVMGVKEWGGVVDTVKDLFDDFIGLVMAYVAQRYFKGRDF